MSPNGLLEAADGLLEYGKLFAGRYDLFDILGQGARPDGSANRQRGKQ